MAKERGKEQSGDMPEGVVGGETEQEGSIPESGEGSTGGEHSGLGQTGGGSEDVTPEQ